jgi:hypothetical protein
MVVPGVTGVVFPWEQRPAANEGILLITEARSEWSPRPETRRMTMTTNINEAHVEALTDAELEGVAGGYSWSEFKADVVGAAKALNQGIHDGYQSTKQMLS